MFDPSDHRLKDHMCKCMRRNQTGLRAYMESTDKHMARWEAYLEKGLAKDELQAKDELRARDELHGNVINRQVSKPRNTHETWSLKINVSRGGKRILRKHMLNMSSLLRTSCMEMS